MTFDALLVPTDGSEPAEAAAASGFDLAAELGATVHLLPVADSGIATSATDIGDSPRIRERLRERADAHATELADRARDRGLDVVSELREGIPAEEITDYASANDIDAIAIGTHGRGGFTRAVVGSVTDEVLRTASVPVLTVRPDTMNDHRAETKTDAQLRVAFMCVRNAGRSQMATAFAERERERRGLEDEIAILTGGTRPADGVHDEVIEVMAEAGFDLSDRTPREITIEELRSCDYVATMGCSTLDVGEVGDDVEIRDWALEDPAGRDRERVREIRDEVERRVKALFDEFRT